MIDRFSDKKIAVLMGGLSGEREVSLKSGAAVLGALTSAGYRAVGVRHDGPDVVDRLKDVAPDVVFIALHGRYGEDGCVQGLLEVMGLPYTGSGVCASAVAMDKALTKKLMVAEGILTPAFEVLRRSGMRGRGPLLISPPLVVKPSNSGSTIGMGFVFDGSALEAAIDEAFRHDDTVILEEYIEGRELTVGVLDGEPMTLVEIMPEGGIYDYKAKYTSGRTVYVCPAVLAVEVSEKLKQTAAAVFEMVGCSGAARVDFRLAQDGRAYALEINTIPGMTETSLLPKAALVSGMDFTSLVENILMGALDGNV